VNIYIIHISVYRIICIIDNISTGDTLIVNIIIIISYNIDIVYITVSINSGIVNNIIIICITRIIINIICSIILYIF